MHASEQSNSLQRGTTAAALPSIISFPSAACISHTMCTIITTDHSLSRVRFQVLQRFLQTSRRRIGFGIRFSGIFKLAYLVFLLIVLLLYWKLLFPVLCCYKPVRLKVLISTYEEMFNTLVRITVHYYKQAFVFSTHIPNLTTIQIKSIYTMNLLRDKPARPFGIQSSTLHQGSR